MSKAIPVIGWGSCDSNPGCPDSEDIFSITLHGLQKCQRTSYIIILPTGSPPSSLITAKSELVKKSCPYSSNSLRSRDPKSLWIKQF